jgi:hypothetical protein
MWCGGIESPFRKPLSPEAGERGQVADGVEVIGPPLPPVGEEGSLRNRLRGGHRSRDRKGAEKKTAP